MGQCMSIKNECFIPIEQIKPILQREYGLNVEDAWINELCRIFMLTEIKQGDDRYVFDADVEVCRRLAVLKAKFSLCEIEPYDYYGSTITNMLKIADDTILLYEYCNERRALPVFIRNIVLGLYRKTDEECSPKVFEVLGVTILTKNKSVCNYIEDVISRKNKLECIKSSFFSNSSSFMGSKKRIQGFIIEAIIAHGNDESKYLDIMCGSGAVSNAFAQIGPVYASDAQSFCRILAKMQGRGYRENEAVSLTEAIYQDYWRHMEDMRQNLSEFLREEERIFYLDLKEKETVLKQYSDFIEKYELYSSDCDISEKLDTLIKKRKQNHSLFPYCLFTYYFSNVYFGLTQSIQIDSIRYAIDQIGNKEIREWALGALIATVSSIGTTYSAQFAQPKHLDEESLTAILERRQKSVWYEFSRRFAAIAKDSERYQYPVVLLDGPWETALEEMKRLCDRNVIVYLDAPYKREEYSRYYHVLETLVKYDYPEAEKKGRMRSKKNGERFSTEFSTRNTEKVEECFEKIILDILHKGYICAWSYSDNGCASILNVVNRVKRQFECNVYFYSTAHYHNSQGKNASKIPVVEYCILFRETNT